MKLSPVFSGAAACEENQQLGVTAVRRASLRMSRAADRRQRTSNTDRHPHG